MNEIKFHEPDFLFDEPYYLGSVPCNGQDVYFLILKNKDAIEVDADSVVCASNNMTIEEFTQSDVFLDIVSVYQQLTGKAYVLDRIGAQNESVSTPVQDLTPEVWQQIKTQTLH